MKLCNFLALFSIVSRQEAVHVSNENLLDSKEFFVCGSKVPGIDGHYLLQPDVIQSDPDTPVFFREDDEDAEERDFRLFRHNGFWMLADVESWPPVTHFRCDPTKSQVGIDVSEVCGLGLATPPRIGYSPVNTKLGDFYLTLQTHACEQPRRAENYSVGKEDL
ncbi:hypothetical protein PHMEG_0007238 [Phytophthora megakarya]|uniref:Uncharacterized protein n=1 Tax=Phytophthora megakarya TaxID=4795 RepID=A0A225WN07_9STRA|nr:hypothetical protein PHMEG_0007238 [Phytophthora megakarya]